MTDREQAPPAKSARSTRSSTRPAIALVDWQIDEAVKLDGLIVEGYQESSARYATYEAHASDYVHFLDYSENQMTVHKRMAVQEDLIWIEPGETLKIYTSEVFNLGENMYAMATGLGQLYACGLTIGCTYVDPGSRGAIYLAVTNISPRAVSIPVGSPIARIQFWRLGEKPNKQHPGHQARRRIELRARDKGAGVRKAPEQKTNRPAVPLELIFVGQTFFFLGLFWYANPKIFDDFFSFAAGDNLPPLAHFLVPVIFGPLVFLAVRALWRLIAPASKRLLRRVSRSTFDELP